MSKVVCRTIIPTAFAGNIFGKGGSVLNEMRDTFKAKISIPNSDGPERNVYVESMDVKDVASCTVALALRIQEDMQKINKSLGVDDIELRMLLHTSQAGHVIGHKGDNISALRKETDCKIKLHSLKCPMSTDRICQISGKVANVTDCLDKILADLTTTPLEGNVIQYDANMFNEREEYGGFKSWIIESATGKVMRRPPGDRDRYNDRYNDRGDRRYDDRRDRDDGGERRPRGYDSNRFGMQKQYDDPNEEDKIVCRILIPTRLAGAIIGKGGETVNEMRMAHDCEISIPTSTTPERTVRVMAAEHKSVIDCMRQILDVIGEELRRAGRIVDENMSEIRLLMHDSHAGYVIGQGGKNIKQLRIDTDCRIILNTEHAPFSTDRVCQISGTKDSIVMALDRILVMIDETPIKGDKRRYNANYADDRIDYGGYRGSRRYFNHDGEGDGGNREGGRRDNYREDREPRGPREPRDPREPREDRQNRSYYNNDRRDNERYGNERSFNQRNGERSFNQSNNNRNDNNNYDQDNRDYGRSNNYSRTRDNFDNSYDRTPGNYHNSERFGGQRNERYGNGDSYNNRSNNNNGFGQARDNQNHHQQQGSFFDRPQGGYNSNNNDRYGSNQQQQYDNNSRYNNNNKQQDRYASDNRFGNTWDNKQYSNTGNNSQGSNKDLQVNKNENNDLNGNVKFTPRGVNDDGKENQDE